MHRLRTTLPGVSVRGERRTVAEAGIDQSSCRPAGGSGSAVRATRRSTSRRRAWPAGPDATIAGPSSVSSVFLRGDPAHISDRHVVGRPPETVAYRVLGKKQSKAARYPDPARTQHHPLERCAETADRRSRRHRLSAVQETTKRQAKFRPTARRGCIDTKFAWKL